MVIIGFHLLLLVTVTRDSAVCHGGISLSFICSYFISSLLLCWYVAYDNIKFYLEDFLLQRRNGFHCILLFHSYMYHVLVYNCITFVFKTRSTASSRQKAMIFSRQSVCSVMKPLFKGPGTRHQPFVSAITLSCQNVKYCYCSAYWIMILAFLLTLHF